MNTEELTEILNFLTNILAVFLVFFGHIDNAVIYPIDVTRTIEQFSPKDLFPDKDIS